MPPPPANSASPGTRLRVVLLLDVLDGRHQHFLAAYEEIRHQVASVPGHISDQLCQSLGNSSQWLITSEWADSESFLEWVESAAHRKMVEPLHGCVRDTTSLRFVITAETPDPAAGPAAKKRAPRAAAGLDPLPEPPLCSGGVVRHAITFTVKPGSEPKVAEILAGYRSPQARVDDTTRLLRTSLFMHGNRVVRAVEVHGELVKALRHVAEQPEVRAVEEAINPYLEVDRDLSDPHSIVNYFQPGVFQKFNIGKKLNLGFFTGYIFSQTNGFSDSDSDFFLANVATWTPTDKIRIENTALFFNLTKPELSTTLANRFLVNYFLKKWKFDLYVWERIEFRNNFFATSASFAVKSA